MTGPVDPPDRPPNPRRALLAVTALAAALAGTLARSQDVKRFHGRELKETTYKGIPIRYFVERFSVERQKLASLLIDASKKDDAEFLRFVEFMGEAHMAEPGSYVRCDMRLFDEGDKEKWIYRRVGSSWVAQRVFHPRRKAQIKLGSNERLVENAPNGEIIVEGSVPQFPSPEDYVRWMAIRVSLAKEPEVPIGQEIPMVKHVVVSE